MSLLLIKMRPMPCLQLPFVFVLSFLASQTICHPRPTASSLVTAVDLAQNSYDVRVASTPDFTIVQRAAGASLRRRSPGFQHFLELGEGWNMYYSSWSSIALPVRKYQREYRTPTDLVAAQV